MRLPKDDVLDALVTDLVADQVIRALQFGYDRKDLEAAVARGLSHGVYEFERFRGPSRSLRARVGARHELIIK
jgi:hypothetical protein